MVLPAQIGLTKTQMSRPRTREFVFNLLERHGVLQEARRESQILSSQKRLSGQVVEVVSGDSQTEMFLVNGDDESRCQVGEVIDGRNLEYSGSGLEDGAMLVGTLNLSDVECPSLLQQSAPQDQSLESSAKKSRTLESPSKLNTKKMLSLLSLTANSRNDINEKYTAHSKPLIIVIVVSSH